MMFIVAAVATALLSYALGFLLPWWCVALAAALIASVVNQRPIVSAASGFLGVFLLWIAHATWIHVGNHGLLSTRIATLLPLQGSAVLLIVVTGIIGGAVGGLAGLSGAFLRRSLTSDMSESTV